MSAFSVPTSARVLSAFPKNSEDDVLFWRRSQSSWIMCRSRAARFISEKFQGSVGNFLIDLRQARPTRIALLGGEQVMTHSGREDRGQKFDGEVLVRLRPWSRQ